MSENPFVRWHRENLPDSGLVTFDRERVEAWLDAHPDASAEEVRAMLKAETVWPSLPAPADMPAPHCDRCGKGHPEGVIVDMTLKTSVGFGCMTAEERSTGRLSGG